MSRRAVAAAIAIGLTLGCGNWQRVGSQDHLTNTETFTQLIDAERFYHQLGRLAAGEPLPFVGSLAFAPGPADSADGVLALSLEARNLTFQKSDTAFAAHYHIEIVFQPVDGAGEPVRIVRDDSVRVGSYQLTRQAKTVVAEENVRLLPGSYKVLLTVRDAVSRLSTSASQAVVVPQFQPGSVTAPMLVYQATGRSSPTDSLKVLLNARGTVAFGGDTLLAYIEGYRMPAGSAVPFEVRTASDSVVFRDSLRFTGATPIESQIIRLRPDSMPLGELKLAVGPGDSLHTTSAMVSFSTAWVVTNYTDMIDLLRYFGEDRLLDSVKHAPPDQRAQAWARFWKQTDPDPTTPQNEALDAYFNRVRIANQRFTGEGEPGWRTDRGEVLITLGEPDEVYDAHTMSEGRAIRWTYIQYRVDLYFTDPTGFGQFRLTPTSRSDYTTVLNRLRQRQRSR